MPRLPLVPSLAAALAVVVGGLGVAAGYAASSQAGATSQAVTLSGAATVTTPAITIGGGFVRPGDTITSPVTLTGSVPVPTVTQTQTVTVTTTTPTPAPPGPTTTTSPTPPSPGLLWSADTETGNLAQWNNGGGEFDSGTGAASVQTSIVHSGRYAAAMRITGANGNASQAVRLFRWTTSSGAPLPDAAYYSAWLYFPTRVAAPTWWNVFQWKTKVSSSVIDPTMVLNVGNQADGSMNLYLWDWIRKTSAGTSPVALPVGRWVHVEAFYQWSTARTGRVTFWQDGQQIIDAQGVQTAWPSSDPNAKQWSLSNYADTLNPPDVTVYADDAAIASSFIP